MKNLKGKGLKSLMDYLSSTQKTTVRAAKEALGALTKREQIVVEKYIVDGWTYNDIGDGLGISISRVSAILNRAVKKMRR